MANYIYIYIYINKIRKLQGTPISEGGNSSPTTGVREPNQRNRHPKGKDKKEKTTTTRSIHPTTNASHQRNTCKEKEGAKRAHRARPGRKRLRTPTNPPSNPGTPPPLNPTDASTGRVAPPTHGKCRN